MNEEAKFFRLFGSIFAGVGSIFAITGIIIGLNTHSFVAKSIPAQGTVIDLVKRSSTNSKGRISYYYYPVIKYSDRSGESIVFESSSGSNPPGFTKGQQVELLYNPQNSNSPIINSWFELWLLPLIFTSIGSTFTLIGVVVIIKSFPRLFSFK